MSNPLPTLQWMLNSATIIAIIGLAFWSGVVYQRVQHVEHSLFVMQATNERLAILELSIQRQELRLARLEAKEGKR